MLDWIYALFGKLNKNYVCSNNQNIPFRLHSNMGGNQSSIEDKIYELRFSAK